MNDFMPTNAEDVLRLLVEVGFRCRRERDAIIAMPA